MTTSTCSISQVQLYKTFKAGLNQSLTTITGFKITQAGFDAFVKSLGLLPMASGALNTVTDYGTITTQISVQSRSRAFYLCSDGSGCCPLLAWLLVVVALPKSGVLK